MMNKKSSHIKRNKQTDSSTPLHKRRQNSEFNKTNRKQDIPFSDTPSDFLEDEESSMHPKQAGAMRALMQLDEDLMKLLVRRGTLVSRIRGGKEHASTPHAILAEKTIRRAWEKAAPRFSKDPRFARQLFALLQDISVINKDSYRDGFKLYPSKEPIFGTISGPLSCETAQIYIFLSAITGKNLELDNLPLSTTLLDTIKLVSQLGASIAWEATDAASGKVIITTEATIDFSEKNIFVGNSLFTLYLIAFIVTKMHGTYRLTGGSILKDADLTSLRNLLPHLGARLAPVIPHATGLPVNIESSGVLPDTIVLPNDLPLEGVKAYLVASLLWDIPHSIDLKNISAPDATCALALLDPLVDFFETPPQRVGTTFQYTPSNISLPVTPQIALDPVLSAYVLAMPAFTGGSITLQGIWSHDMPEAQIAKALLEWAGISIVTTEASITATKVEKTRDSLLPALALPSGLAPLFFSIAALRTHQTISPLLPKVDFESDATLGIAEEIYSRIGYELVDDRICSLPREEAKDNIFIPWACPDAYWGLGFALCALIRPGIQIANPIDISDTYPLFWPLFNSLPHAEAVYANIIPKGAKNNDDTKLKARRRVITD